MVNIKLQNNYNVQYMIAAIHGYKLGFCRYVSDSLGVGSFRRILGLVDAFTIGLSTSMGGLGNLQK